MNGMKSFAKELMPVICSWAAPEVRLANVG